MSQTCAIPDPEVVESPPFDLLRTPVIGRFLRWRHSRTALQIRTEDYAVAAAQEVAAWSL